MPRGLGLAVALVSFALIPTGASAATIDFEDRTPGETVNAQYNSQGVTFNGPVAYDYGPGFAHSGTKAIENCRGIEFCGAPPIRADFTAGQTTVGVWVGYNATPGGGSRAIRLTAFDGGGAEVGHDDVTLPPASPATNHLTVTAAGPTIRALEVKPNDGADSYDIVVDDVEFSTEGPPPPCGAFSRPFINLTSPQEGAFFQNNSILLRGTVNTAGAPITSATVVSEGNTTRTANGFPTPIDADGGSFAINMNGLLQEGNQNIRVTATNCAGTGVSGNRGVAYDPLPATAGFQQLAPVEVVQSVQSSFNPVPLIAGSLNGTKRTIARVQLTATGTNLPITNVSGRLTATRLDGSPPGGPLTIDSLNTITVGAGQSLAGARSDINRALNFELPPEWVTEGRLHLQLEQLRIEGAQTTLPCRDCDNWGGIPATVTFHRVPPVRIWLVGVPYTGTVAGVSTTISPRQKDFDFLASWLRRAYPTAEVQLTQAAMPLQPRLPGDCHDLNDDLSEWAATMPAQPSQTRYYGVVSDTGGFMRGCAGIGGRFGSGPAGSGNFGWDFDGAYTDWYGGHEIGHMYDRKHPDGGCDDSDDDGSFPFAGGNIGDSVFTNQAFDVGDASLTPAQPMKLTDWTVAHDVMTYCNDQWPSSYTYNGILRNLCGKDKPNCPNHEALTKTSAKRDGPRLALHGTLNLANDRVSLEPMSALAGLTLTERPRKSPYAIVLRGAGGKKLGTYPFEPKEISDQPPGRELAAIDEVVPFSKRTERIEIAQGGKRLFSKPVSENAPEVNLRSPKGKRLDQPVKLRWRAHDADGGRLLSTVQYAADGKHFTTIAAGLRKRSLKVDPDALPGGGEARLRVVVTDGVLTGIDRSKPVKVAAKPPRISIAAPVDGAVLTEGQSVQMIASVVDDQEARLGDEVAWSSDLQGPLSLGAAAATTLVPGTHRITAAVTNNGAMTSTASVGVVVEEIPQTVDAQLIP